LCSILKQSLAESGGTEDYMKAVITVTGKDKVGIIAMTSAECSKFGANIEDISQTVLGEYFAMIMLVSLDGLCVSFSEFKDAMKARGEENGVDIRVMHEDIFNTMHRI
jgi:ACT domain-containing protein